MNKVLGGYAIASDVIAEKTLTLLNNMNIQMSIAVNRTTKELVGYWTPKGKSIGIVVTAYAVDDLQKKFDVAVELYKKQFPQITVGKDVNNKTVVKENGNIIGAQG